jgi:cytochrome P450
LLFQGHETSAVTTSWVILCLASHPDIQEKAQNEIDGIFGNDKTRPITLTDIRKMDYLEMVIKETLRIYPTAASIMRLIQNECKLGITVAD